MARPGRHRNRQSHFNGPENIFVASKWIAGREIDRAFVSDLRHWSADSRPVVRANRPKRLAQKSDRIESCDLGRGFSATGRHFKSKVGAAVKSIPKN